MVFSLSRRGEVEPFYAMDVLAEANRLKAQGLSVVSMAVGQPSDPAPARIRAAAARALQHGRIGYTDTLGLAELRQAIARHYEEHYGVNIPPSRIAVTTGSSAAFNLGTRTFCASSMSRKALAGDLPGACAALSLYVYAGGVRMRGLERRREAEKALCLKGLKP